MRLLLATRNRHKIREMLAILGDLEGWQLLSLDQFPQAPTVEETGKTLEENASLKVQQAVTATGLLCLAEDTGLEIDGLGGRPGIRSARFAGEKASYQENVDKVLKLLRSVPEKKRTARFRSTVAIMGPGGHPRIFEGICPGTITAERRGSGGFGYDPIFLPDGRQQTFAEMEAAEKNRISHRARALQEAKQYLLAMHE
jgi:XTP/dITP diphosphohydrolase